MRRFGKWTVAVIVALLCVMMVGVASASTVASGNCGAQGNNLTWKMDSNGTLTISGTGRMEDFDFYNGAPWYDYIFNIKSVQIGNDVTSIGERAFGDCYNMVSVTIPYGVTSIGSSAFVFCFNLGSVEIPSSVTRIGPSAFAFCESLTSLTIPWGVELIGSWAFDGCTSLTNVTIPSSLTSISFGMFNDCTSLTSVTIPTGVTSIEDYAFSDCKKLKSVTIPSGVTSIGDLAFKGCTKLTKLTIPSSVTTIGKYAFGYDYESWSETYIPIDGATITGMPGTAAETYAKNNGITFHPLGNASAKPGVASGTCGTNMWWTLDSNGKLTIGGKGRMEDYWGKPAPWYKYSNKITSVKIGDSVTSIGAWAFEDCRNMTNVVIPSSVTTIGDYAVGYFYDYDSDTKKRIDGVTITGVPGTAAETYAKKNSITFIAIGTQLATPKLSSVENTAKGITIKWGKVKGAENYRVYYKTTGSWKKLTDTTKTSYTWTKAKSGTKYTFTVKCVNKAGNKATSAYDTTGKSIMYLATPKLTSVENTTKGITIKWGKVSGANKYRVYYKTNGSWKKLADTTSTSYTWTKAKSGTKYSFTVASLTSSGKTASAYDTTGKSITYLAAPKISSVKGSSKGITIKWDKVSGAAKYRVYYKTTGGWKKLTETKSTSYTWTKAKSGTKYTFTVCSLSSTGKTSSAYDTKGVSLKYAN